MHNGSGCLLQPGSHQIKSRIHRERTAEQAKPSSEPEECQENSPGEADGFLSGQNRFQPGLRLPVQWSVLIDGVNQKVRIEKYHLRNASFRLSSSSSIASAKASALSHSNSCPFPL